MTSLAANNHQFEFTVYLYFKEISKSFGVNAKKLVSIIINNYLYLFIIIYISMMHHKIRVNVAHEGFCVGDYL